MLSQASIASEAANVEEGGGGQRDGPLRVNGMAKVLLSRYGEPAASSQSAEEAMKVRVMYACILCVYVMSHQSSCVCLLLRQSCCIDCACSASALINKRVSS